jgi:hypothetical protein
VRSNVARQRDSLMVLDLASGGVRKLLDNRAIDAINLFGVEWQPLTGADEITLPQTPPRTGPCQLLGSKTVARSRRARVLTENQRYWGCLFARDRLYRLAPPPRYVVDASYGNVALAGPYVGYALKYDDGQAIFADVHVQDLRDGRVLHSANSIHATERVYQARMRRLVLSRRGSLAWAVRPYTGGGTPRPVQVRTLRRGRAVTLDAGPGIRASTLALRGHRLTWRHGDRSGQPDYAETPRDALQSAIQLRPVRMARKGRPGSFADR